MVLLRNERFCALDLSLSHVVAVFFGQMVAIARHPSNEFFYSFANCVTFDPLDPKEFAEVLSKAAQATPRPLSEEDKVSLGWAAATERLVEAAATPKLADPGPRSSRQAREALRPSRGLGAGLLYGFHQFLGAGLVGMVLRDLTGTISELAPLVAEVKKDVKDQGPYRGLFGCLGFNPGALEGGLQGLDPALEARKAVAFAVLWLFASSALATPIAVNKLQPNLAPELVSPETQGASSSSCFFLFLTLPTFFNLPAFFACLPFCCCCCCCLVMAGGPAVGVAAAGAGGQAARGAQKALLPGGLDAFWRPAGRPQGEAPGPGGRGEAPRPGGRAVHERLRCPGAAAARRLDQPSHLEQRNIPTSGAGGLELQSKYQQQKKTESTNLFGFLID